MTVPLENGTVNPKSMQLRFNNSVSRPPFSLRAWNLFRRLCLPAVLLGAVWSEASGEDDEAIKRRTIVDVDQESLVELMNLKPGLAFEFPWFDNATLFVEVDSVEVRETSMDVMGHVPDRKVGKVILTLGSDALVGSVLLDSESFRIHRVEGEAYAIEEIDVSSLMPRGLDSDTYVDYREVRKGSRKGLITSYNAPGHILQRVRPYTAEKLPDREFREILKRGAWKDGFDYLPSGDDHIIDILIAYTGRAADWVSAGGSDINLEIQNMVSKANNAFQLSGVRVYLQVVHTTEVDYTVRDASLEDDIDLLKKDGDGVLDGVLALRDQYHADLVSLLVRNNTAGGRKGYAITPRPVHLSEMPQAEPGEPIVFVPDPYYEEHGFSVVDIQAAVSAYTFPHEVGHNLGAHHDNPQFDQEIMAGKTKPTFHNFARGWILLDQRLRTIMSYDTFCKEVGWDECEVIPFFSNPYLSYGNEPLGSLNDFFPLGRANNVEAMNQFAWTVANYRNPVWP